MITLITGTPGSGKTAWAVHELAKLEANRPIFVDGVPELLIPHEVADAANWQEWAPDGALILVDECQRIWRPRATGSKVPDSVAALETHRHRGIDFWLITQNPSLVDPNIRRLVGRHIHLVAKWAGRYAYEWPECKSQTDNVSDAIKRPYTLPRKVFGQYKSAVLHTKLRKAKPLSFYAFWLLLVLLGVGGWRVVERMREMTAPMSPPVAQAGPTGGASASTGGTRPVTGGEPLEDWHPRVKGRPETAPAYDNLRRVQSVPLPNACIAAKDRCICYTAQGTQYPIADAICRDYVRGLIFDPYREPFKDKAAPAMVAPAGMTEAPLS